MAARFKFDRVFLLTSVLLVALAAFLRIHHLAERSLWFDEAVAANISRGTLNETLTLTRAEHSAPVAHPLILYAVEKIADGPFAVRSPSLVASLLAVCLMLCSATISAIDQKTAALSALMLSVSAAQIRYAQEVREYALCVLAAVILLHLFLRVASNREERYTRILLYLTLFTAPLVQYGLVLFSLAVLAALFILAVFRRNIRAGVLQITVASLFLVAGSLLSFILTLRYQWEGPLPYLEGLYFTPGSSLPGFVWSNTHDLLVFLLPGLGAAVISGIAIIFYIFVSFQTRYASPLVVLAFTSFGTALACALLRLYPYGGTRQCLFLAPVLCLLSSVSLVQITNRFPVRLNRAIFVAIVCIVLISGALQIRSVKPYQEIEDIQRVLTELRSHLRAGDGVYVYSGAVPAVDFYVKARNQGFLYGDFHRKAPGSYVPEMLSSLRPGTSRIWMVFSHIYNDEDRQILYDLGPQWEAEPACLVQGAALYRASRADTFEGHQNGAQSDNSSLAGGRLADTFWDWNIRNHADRVKKAGLKFPANGLWGGHVER